MAYNDETKKKKTNGLDEDDEALKLLSDGYDQSESYDTSANLPDTKLPDNPMADTTIETPTADTTKANVSVTATNANATTVDHSSVDENFFGYLDEMRDQINNPSAHEAEQEAQFIKDRNERIRQSLAGYERIVKYLPTLNKSAGMEGLGISESGYIEAAQNRNAQISAAQQNYDAQRLAYNQQLEKERQARLDKVNEIEAAYRQAAALDDIEEMQKIAEENREELRDISKDIRQQEFDVATATRDFNNAMETYKFTNATAMKNWFAQQGYTAEQQLALMNQQLKDNVTLSKLSADQQKELVKLQSDLATELWQKQWDAQRNATIEDRIAAMEDWMTQNGITHQQALDLIGAQLKAELAKADHDEELTEKLYAKQQEIAHKYWLEEFEANKNWTREQTQTALDNWFKQQDYTYEQQVDFLKKQLEYNKQNGQNTADIEYALWKKQTDYAKGLQDEEAQSEYVLGIFTSELENAKSKAELEQIYARAEASGLFTEKDLNLLKETVQEMGMTNEDYYTALEDQAARDEYVSRIADTATNTGNYLWEAPESGTQGKEIKIYSPANGEGNDAKGYLAEQITGEGEAQAFIVEVADKVGDNKPFMLNNGNVYVRLSSGEVWLVKVNRGSENRFKNAFGLGGKKYEDRDFSYTIK